MKKYIAIFIIGLAFLSVFAVNEASAQTPKSINAEVPFEFRVGGKTYPAGTYRLESVNQGSDNLLQLRGIGGKNRQRLLVTRSLFAARPQTPKLVFQRIGEEYYLSNIFMEDGERGFSVPLAGSKVAKAKKLAATKTVEIPVTN